MSPTNLTGPLDYRPDIDGLRGLAIAIVVGFHYGVPGFSGGFVGVDVFFVISGYLITQILRSMPGPPGQKLIRFASRRVKRLLPSVIFLIAVFYVLVTRSLHFFDVDRFAEEAVGFLGFHSNYLFYDESGYFDADSEEKLLLHSWSLSIEWQFYAFWSLVLITLLAVVRRTGWIVAVIVGLLLLSFAWSVSLVSDDRAGAFYLIQSRLWEFLVGAVIAVLPPARLGKNQASGFCIAGLLLIIVPAGLYDGATAFPGWAALPVIIGTALVIIAGSNGQFAGPVAVLGSRPAALLGQTSYSLYLWHWPLLIYTTLLLGRQVTVGEKIGLISLSVGLSFVLWHWLEKPFRRHWRWPDLSVIGTGLGASAALLALCLLIREFDGWPLHRKDPLVDRLATQSREINPLIGDCVMTAKKLEFAPDRCLFGNQAGSPEEVDFVVLGDSHGDHWIPGLAALAESSGLTGLQLTADSCLPIKDITTVFDGQPYNSCQVFRTAAFKFLDDLSQPKTVILAARWSIYYETTQFLRPDAGRPYYAVDASNQSLDVETTQRVIRDNLGTTIEWLESRGHRVVLLGQIAEFGFSQTRCVARQLLKQTDADLCGPPPATLQARLAPVHRMLEDFGNRFPGINVVLPHKALCNSATCRQVIDGDYLYRDANHLNATGSERVVSLIADELRLTPASALP